MVKSYFIKIVFFSIIILLLIGMNCGCKQLSEVVSNDVINSSNFSSQEDIYDNITNTEKIKPQKLNIDAFDYLGISGKYFYYISLANYDIELTDSYIMRYDLQTDETTKIGEIKNLSTWSGVNAFVNSDKLFATFGVVEDEESCNIHTKIDLKSGGVTILSRDNNFPPLVANIAVNEKCFVEEQARKLEDGSYRYFVRVIDPNDGNSKDLIVKNRKADNSGEMIVSTCVYDDIIYTFEYDAQDAYVCSYDLEGNLLTKESVKLLNEFLKNSDTMWGINVINGYYFFETLNGKRLVLHKSDNGWIKREDLIMNRTGSISNLIVNYNAKDENYKKVVLYDYINKQLSYLDTDTGEKIDLDIELPGATYCMTDGKQLVYMNDKQELYYIADVFAK